MLRALLLDLGDTLVRADKVIAHVPEALTQLAALPTEQHVPLQLALVSDYTMAGPGAGPEAIAKLFEEYVELVRGFGLLRYFEPVEQHITLSTQAGVKKPDAKIFQLALRRLQLPPDLASAMLITEASDHVAAARQLGMTAWQYGKDFDDWTSAPVLVARALHGDDAHSLPAPVLPPEAEAAYRRSLEQTGALGAAGEPLAPGQTHVLEPGPDGKLKPTRKRFSLW